MRRTLCRLAAPRRGIESRTSPPLIQISNATFFRHHPSPALSVASKSKDDSHDADSVDSNPPLFPGLNFTLPSFSSPKPNQHWSVLSNSSAARTTFFQILRGQHICLPPTARSYPYLATDEIAQKDLRLRSPSHSIQYVGFDAERGRPGGGGMRGAYMSARYESRKEETDFSLKDFLLGNTNLNADERLLRHPDQASFEQVVDILKLLPLIGMPVTQLSNGQTRRARIAKALLAKPEVLLLDGPFMGLDPPTLRMLSSLLYELAEAQAPRLILSLKPDEHIPDWITHMAFVTKHFKVDSIGTREEVFKSIRERFDQIDTGQTRETLEPRNLSDPRGSYRTSIERNDEEVELIEIWRHLRLNEIQSVTDLKQRRRSRGSHVESENEEKDVEQTDVEDLELEQEEQTSFKQGLTSRDGFTVADDSEPPVGEALVEMKGVTVQYGDRAVLGNWTEEHDGVEKRGLWWTVSRGQRWGVFGPNGSGKTTLISLMTSDHPQTYSLPIALFGRSRLPQPGQPGISIFDIQSRIGHSSPEVHTFFPKHLTLRRTVESAWADAPLTRPRLTHEADEKVSATLQWFRAELHPTLGPTKLQADEMNRLARWDVINPERSQSSAENSRILQMIEKEMIEEELDVTALDWADTIRFGELSFSAQRVALFLRAVIRNPDIVILDEAFSGMDDFARDKCHLFLSRGESAIFKFKAANSRAKRGTLLRMRGLRPRESDISRLGRIKIPGLTKKQALIIVSHKKEEVPGCVRDWICLPEASDGVPPRIGHLDVPLELGISGWREIWGETDTKVHDTPNSFKIKLRLRKQRLRTPPTRRTSKEKREIESLARERHRVVSREVYRGTIATETRREKAARLKRAREYQRRYREERGHEWKIRKRKRDQEKYRQMVASENEEQKAARLERAALFRRMRRKTESQAQKEEQNRKERVSRQKRRKKMTEEEIETARAKKRARYHKCIEKQTPEQRAAYLEKRREQRMKRREDPEKREKYLASLARQSERKRRLRTEDPEWRAAQLAKEREYNRQRRARARLQKSNSTPKKAVTKKLASASKASTTTPQKPGRKKMNPG